ncbi:Aste57867_15516 [Aphanomyces stellatus]|uniref:Aste57867_15516 protein n=1 Tax=Aphanomyces stellatus TaxID=120398 RepID=A0A485L4N4_9STRA|nr:hypothetical protein As57867_015460 [Aphanomyces stellatus]VFT92318.1 Aste57867_15516 [Aphanomyces stellatus]
MPPRQTPTSSSAPAVLQSPDLVQCLCAYQDGAHLDFLPFRHLRVSPCVRSNPAIPIGDLEHIHAVVQPWLAIYGLCRLTLLTAWKPALTRTLLLHAAFVGDVSELECLLASLPVATETTSLLDELAHVAASQGHLFVLDVLERQDKYGGHSAHTLQVAAFAGQLFVLQRFATASDTTKSLPLFGPHVLEWAAAGGDLTVVEWLVTTQMGGGGVSSPAIVLAASHGHCHVIEWFVKHNHTQGNLSEAVAGAAANGHLACVQYLYDRGSKCPTFGLEMAAANGHMAVVHYLIASGWGGSTIMAAYLAQKNDHSEVVQCLSDGPVIRSNS